MSERVYVAEVGHGARAGSVVRRYHSDDPAKAGDRVIVKLDDYDCPRDCFSSSVFATRAEAEAAAMG